MKKAVREAEGQEVKESGSQPEGPKRELLHKCRKRCRKDSEGGLFSTGHSPGQLASLHNGSGVEQSRAFVRIPLGKGQAETLSLTKVNLDGTSRASL